MFAKASTSSTAELNPWRGEEQIFAVRNIRHLTRHSNASLVECSDGLAYVVKRNNDSQGPNTLANEVLGNLLANTSGLPVPCSAPIIVTDHYLTQSQHSVCGRSAGYGISRSGTYFGSRFAGDVDGSQRVFETVLPSHALRVVNRKCFLGMYLLDVAANLQNRRQAVFLRVGDALDFRAVFIDHGQMFGGGDWMGSPEALFPLHRTRSLYHSLWNDDDVASWITTLQGQVPRTLAEAVPLVPRRWFRGDIMRVHDELLGRLEVLPQLAVRYCFSDVKAKSPRETNLSRHPHQYREGGEVPET